MIEKSLIKISVNPKKVDIVIPQEAVSYVKLPAHLLKWQVFLSPTQWSVLTYLISKIHKQLHYAFPSYKTASFDCNISENTFHKSVQVLENLDLVTIDKSRKNNRYYLKPPNSPSLELIENYLPKMLEKFKSLDKNKKNNEKQSSLQFNKILYMNKNVKPSFEKKNTENFDKVTSNKDSLSPQNFKSITNLQIQNLPKQQQKQEKFVVDGRAQLLKDMGIKNHKIPSLIKKLDPSIGLKDFKNYLIKEIIPIGSIRNAPGLIIHGIEHLQDDYLEYRAKKEKVQINKVSEKELTDKLKTLKAKLHEKAISHWKSLSSSEKEKIRNKVDEANIGFQFKLETMELLYTDYVRQNCFGLAEDDLKLLDKSDDKTLLKHDIEFSKLYNNIVKKLSSTNDILPF